MPGDHGETEMATVGVTGVVGAVSAVYYKIPSLPLPLGVRCRCGLHTHIRFVCYCTAHLDFQQNFSLFDLLTLYIHTHTLTESWVMTRRLESLKVNM